MMELIAECLKTLEIFLSLKPFWAWGKRGLL